MEKVLEMMARKDGLVCRFMDIKPLPGQEEALQLIWKYRPVELDTDISQQEKYIMVHKAWREHKDEFLPRIGQYMFQAVCMRSYRGKEDWNA